jgi:hypothetical protein
MRASITIFICAFVGSTIAYGQTCPLSSVSDASLPPVYRSHAVAVGFAGKAVGFRSELARDEDGMPTAYFVGYDDGRPDPGADSICVGGDVLELIGDKLISKYAAGGSVGDLHQSHAQMCKLDYLKIKKDGFPPCGPDHLCMRWYGVAVQERSCGYNRRTDLGCGIPVEQKDKNNNPNGFYLTTNKLLRPGADGNSLAQFDYADASKVPFFVIPGRNPFPGGAIPRPGDYALILANGRSSFAVLGDIGPPKKLGEASRALLHDLHASSIGEGDAYSIVLPGTSTVSQMAWPLSDAEIQKRGAEQLGKVFGLSPALAMAAGKLCATGGAPH